MGVVDFLSKEGGKKTKLILQQLLYGCITLAALLYVKHFGLAESLNPG